MSEHKPLAGVPVPTRTPVRATLTRDWLTITGPVVYRLYDAAGALLYVGATPHFFRRCIDHASEAWWFGLVATYSLEYFDSLVGDGGAMKREAQVIATELPLWNRKHIPSAVRQRRAALEALSDRLNSEHRSALYNPQHTYRQSLDYGAAA